MSAEILGLMWVGRIMFSVCSHCGINLHHECRGKLGLIPSRQAMRWALPVCMALSAQLRRCIWGGVNCRSMFSSLMNCLMGAEHSLSILQYLGWIPLRKSRACTSLNVCRCSAPALVLRHLMSMVFMSYTYTNMM